MAVSGWIAFTNFSTGNPDGWLDAANAASNNGLYARNPLPADEMGAELRCKKLAAPLPANSTVTGIEVRYGAKDGGSGQGREQAVQLLLPSGASLTNRSQGSFLTGSETQYLRGGAGDAWGETLTDAETNDDLFGIALAFLEADGDDDVTIYVDYAEIQFTYTVAATASSHAKELTQYPT